ncbi:MULTISPECIES: hypothetical protein [Aeromicrobium]|uniref:hypothetical protein n=1 Tax=Aeromicrobium TaxID=2040 RepID=UPI00257F89A7|nr:MULTISPECIES: hypothetical protein [Aeromicrobium]
MNTMVRRVVIALLALTASLLIAPAGAAPSSSVHATAAAPVGTISGTVTASPALPAGSQAFVEAHRRLASGEWESFQGGATVTVGRSYSFSVKSTGTYRVRAQIEGSSSSDFRTVSITKGAKRTGVNLVLQPNRTVTGSVAPQGFTVGGLDPEMPLMVAATTAQEDAASAVVRADGSYTLSVPRPYDLVRIRFFQQGCPDEPDAECTFGTAPDVLTTFWNDTAEGAPTFEQARALDLSAAGPFALGNTALTLAQKFSVATKPTITGTRAVGKVLTAQPGRYSPAATSVVYEWYSGSAVYYGEYDKYLGTGRTLKVTPDLLGGSVVVLARPVRAGYEGPTHKSSYLRVKSPARMGLKAKAGKRTATVTVRVAAPEMSAVRVYGKVSIYAKGKRIKTITMRRGKATIKIAKQKKGKRTYTVRWSGNESITPVAKSIKIKIR